MPFCPGCKYEYREGITECPECGVPLVEELEAETSSDSEDEADQKKDWMHVAVLTSEEYALMLQEGLREQGIPIVVMSNTGMLGQTGSMGFGLFNQGSSGYQGYIREDWVDEANTAAEALIGDEWTKARLTTPQKQK